MRDDYVTIEDFIDGLKGTLEVLEKWFFSCSILWMSKLINMVIKKNEERKTSREKCFMN